MDDNINLEYEKEIFEIVKNNPQRYGRMLRAKGGKACGNTHGNPCRLHLLKYVLDQTSFLDSLNPSLRVRLMYLWNHGREFPKCVICRKPVSKIEERYCVWPTKDLDFFLSKQTCCKEHANKMAEQSRKKYFSENYGDGITNVSQLSETIDKIHQTKLENHGDPNYYNAELQKKNCREKYGCDYFLQTQTFKDLAKETKIERYGVDHQMKCPDIVNGMKERYRAAHGVDFPFQNPDVIEKIRCGYQYANIAFDSSWELSYFIWLTDNNVEFTYQPKISIEYIVNGKPHYYNPDFLVEDLLVELKGDQFFKEDGTMFCPWRYPNWTDEDKAAADALYEAKHQCMVANGVKILRNEDVKPYLVYIDEKYGPHYLEQFRRKIEDGEEQEV